MVAFGHGSEYGPSDDKRALAAAQRRIESLARACRASGLTADWTGCLDGILGAALPLADAAGFYTRAGREGELWLLAAYRGNPESNWPRYYRGRDGLVGEVATSGVRLPSGPGLHSATVAAPVQVASEVAGVLLLSRDAEPGFSDEDAEVVEALAGLVAQLLRGAQSEQRLAQLLAERSHIYRFSKSAAEEDAEEGLLDEAVPILARLLGADAGLVYLLPRGENDVGAVGSVGTGPETVSGVDEMVEWWMAAAAVTGRAVVTWPQLPPAANLLLDLDSPSTLLIQTLRSKGRVIGIAGFQRVLAVSGPYGDSDGEILEGLLGLLATAVENLWLRNHDISAFRELSQYSGDGLTMDEISGRIRQKVRMLFPCLDCCIVLAGQPGEDARCRPLPWLGWRSAGDAAWIESSRPAESVGSLPGLSVFDALTLPPGASWPAGEASHLVLAWMEAQGSHVGAIVVAIGKGQSLPASRQLLLASIASQAGLVIRSAELSISSLELAVREERNRIAQEIHDGVAQNLALLLLKMEIISRLAATDPSRMRDELGKVMQVLEASVQELRRSIYALRSPVHSRQGPLAALEQSLHGFAEQTNMEIEVNLPSGISLAPQLQAALVNAIQDRLDALAREGTASEVSVQLLRRPGRVEARISDNGLYRSATGRESPHPNSISRSKERVKPFGGTASLRLQPPGALVEITVPAEDA